ncbi:hypothetical protein JWJ88_21415 (plasmid) [Paracoccus methylovorus]|uniref:Uncharacterized protein n=1 Tax=Paracoccus methylovorus TaxID=2812658 RepID=A0ABX7JPD0_9RHOB|nr:MULTISPECIES: hypothetical protein [Paracoccus]QRZ16103.1 hypothetical protein JWJ88_21415 [Paracoccus methylovorus]
MKRHFGLGASVKETSISIVDEVGADLSGAESYQPPEGYLSHFEWRKRPA